MLTNTRSIATMVLFIRMIVCRIDRPTLAHTIAHISLSLKELVRLFTSIHIIRVKHHARAFDCCTAVYGTELSSESEEERGGSDA